MFLVSSIYKITYRAILIWLSVGLVFCTENSPSNDPDISGVAAVSGSGGALGMAGLPIQGPISGNPSPTFDAGQPDGNQGKPINTAGSTGAGNGSSVPISGTGGTTTDNPASAGTGEAQPISGSGGADAVDSGADSNPFTPSVDCSSLPALPITEHKVISVPGAEDFTFDKLGYILGVNPSTNTLFRATYDGNGAEENIFPSIGAEPGPFPVRGLRFLAGGDSQTGELVYADVGGGGLSKVNLENFSKTPLISGVIQPNGVAVDDKGFAYLTAADGNVYRVDPESGESTIVFPSIDVSIDGIAFSPDYKRLYINTEYGYLSYIPIDDDGEPGEYVIMAHIVGDEAQMGLLDGLTVDECGNIYVVQMSGTIWRVAPDSIFEKNEKVETVVTITSTDGQGRGIHMFAINFGSGINGWKEDAIYIMNMSGNCMYEVVVGVKGAPLPHLP